jgi:SAM-dependent methyltransferase
MRRGAAAMTEDAFATLARYYDRIMAHVDYDRWYLASLALGEMLPAPFRHADLACGTGTLVKRLHRAQWDTVGLDLSPAMLRMGRKSGHPWRSIVGDLRALPFRETFGLITCLFDSINFLLSESDMAAAIQQCGNALRPGGLFYFDYVTEEMVLRHFADQNWTENNGAFSTRWENMYDRSSRITETTIRINGGVANIILERIHSQAAITSALAKAGLHPLAFLDAETWKPPGQKTIRVDVVAVRGKPGPYVKAFRKTQAVIQALLQS